MTSSDQGELLSVSNLHSHPPLIILPLVLQLEVHVFAANPTDYRLEIRVEFLVFDLLKGCLEVIYSDGNVWREAGGKIVFLHRVTLVDGE